MKEQWKDNLRKKMANHEMPAPDGLWDQLEVIMASQDPADVAPKKRRGKVIFWLSGIGAAAAVLAFVLLNGNENTPVTTNTIPTTTKTIQATNIAEAEAEESIITIENNESSAPSPQKIAKKSVSTAIISNLTASNDTPVTETVNVDTPEQKTAETVIENQSAVPSDTISSVVVKKRNTTNGNTPSYPRRTATDIKESINSGRFSASVFASNLSSSSNSVMEPAQAVYYASLTSQYNDPLYYDNLLSDSYGSETDVDHRLPVKAGLSVQYQINDRWGVKSGLTYTYLSSHISSGNSDYSYEIEQRLSYLGIPLGATFNIWQNSRWRIYVAAGGMVEKCIDGKADTDNVINGQVISTEQTSVEIDKLQFSVNAAAGVQMNISSKLGIYVEPGLNYYFDNNSPVPTIYQDKPLNFNLELGFRFSFGN